MAGARFLSKKILEDAAATDRTIQETLFDGRRQTNWEKDIEVVLHTEI